MICQKRKEKKEHNPKPKRAIIGFVFIIFIYQSANCFISSRFLSFLLAGKPNLISFSSQFIFGSVFVKSDFHLLHFCWFLLFYLVTFPIYLSKWWNLCDLAPGACIFLPPFHFLCCLWFFSDQNCIRCIENTYFCVEIINQHEMYINMPPPEA